MRYLAIIFAAFLTACGTCVDVQVEKHEEKPLLLCQQHMTVWVEHELVAEELYLVAEAVYYWNQVLDGTYFYQVAPKIESNELFAGEITVMPSEEVECGAAGWWLGDNCISGGIVYINAKCRSFEPVWKESLYRHEFGHLLGLAHSECDDQLMSPQLSLSNDALPLDATPETIAKLKQLYHDKYGW